MNTDIRLHIEFWQHAKTRKMIRALGLQGPVSLQILWCYAAKNRTTGVLSKMDATDIEDAAGWPAKRRGEFYEYCLNYGWLEIEKGTALNPDEVVHIHEWNTYNPYAAAAGQRSAKAMAAAHVLHHVRKGVSKPEACPLCAASMPVAPPEHATEHAPSPSPSPSPKKEPVGFQPTEEMFDKLWNEYPLKDGRKPALAHFRATVKSAADLEQITAALGNYKRHLALHPTKPKKNGSTWFNNWQDWKVWQPWMEETNDNGSGNRTDRRPAPGADSAGPAAGPKFRASTPADLGIYPDSPKFVDPRLVDPRLVDPRSAK